MTCSYSKEFSSSAFTSIENAFITEYLPVSSGDAVKVYLYGLFLCQNPKMDQSISDVALTLKLSEETVKDCFYFWEEFGLLTVVQKEPFTVQYLPVRSSYSSKPRKYKAEKYTEFTKSLQAILPDRMISTSEYTEYFNIMETYSIKPEAMLMIVKYCADRKGSDIGYRYVSKVAKDFGNRGLITVEKVEKELSSYILRTNEIQNLLNAIGVKRQPEIEDATLLKKWTKELNFEYDNILYAASRLKKSTMAKLDEFMHELYSIKSFSKEEIASYMDSKRDIYDLTIKINKALSIYVDVIDTVVDTYTKKWLSYGFDGECLLYVASHCFKQGKNTLRDMDELLEYLRGRGFIDLSSVGDHFENQKRIDEFIAKVLLTAGVNRRPTPWDRENLDMWKSWNFTEDMILESAKLSSGKSSPIAYMNGILSNWKNNSVFNPSDIQNLTATPSNNSQEAYNKEYERRRSLAHSRAQKNFEKAMEIEGFNKLYSRLNGIEKDLAFAEIANNQDAIEALENEKKTTCELAENLLKKIGLSLKELSIVHFCEKCKDTGYVGTHRCDCFDKKID